MDAHLALNHLPSIGALGALLLLGWGVARRSTPPTLVAFAAMVLVALVGIVVYGTGSAGVSAALAGDRVMDLVERHRSCANAAMVGMMATAATAMAGLFVWYTTRRYPRFAAIATLLIGIAAAALVLRTAALGMEMRAAMVVPAALARP